MKDLSKDISLFTQKIQFGCQAFVDGECNREDGCVCKKMGEIHAIIKELIPDNLRNMTTHDFTGKDKNGNQLIETISVNNIKKILNTYLYGKNILGDQTRIDLNKLSVLNSRYKKGSSVIIHGESTHFENENGRRTKKRQKAGKSLLASIIMTDAIYRKKYPESRFWNYDWISFISLRQILKDRSDKLYDIQEADWLVIDDLTEIDKCRGSRSEIWTREIFDTFLIDRINEKKPTILVCEFDADKVSLEERMGLAFQKLYNDEHTFKVKV